MSTLNICCFFYREMEQIITEISTNNATDTPLYTDTRSNDKIHYNHNLTVMKPSLKR